MSSPPKRRARIRNQADSMVSGAKDSGHEPGQEAAVAELTDEDRELLSLHGQRGSSAYYATTTLADRRRQTAPGRKVAPEGTLRKFEQQIDPNGELDPAERRFRAMHARRA